MDLTMLSEALGYELSKISGLREAELPAGIRWEDAEALVVAANKLRPSDPPYAILVLDEPQGWRETSTIQVTPNDAIAYREGDRLAVLVGSPAKSTSAANSFVTVLGPSFPIAGSSSVSLESLSARALEIVLESSGVKVSGPWAKDEASKRIETVLRTLSNIYEAFGTSREPWNVYWFAHVNRGLANLAIALSKSEPTRRIDDVFSSETFAAFSLPRPTNGTSYRTPEKNLGRVFRDAFIDHWSTKESIQSTIQILAYHSDTQGNTHSLSKVDWDDFSQKAAAFDSDFMAWATCGGDSAVRTSAFSQLSERQFLNPVAADISNEIVVLDANGISLRPADGENVIAHIVSTHFVSEDAKSYIRSQPLEILLPCLGDPSDSDGDNSRAELKVAWPNSKFHGFKKLENGFVVFSGCFEIEVSPSSFTFVPTSVRMTVEMPPNDELISHLPPQTSTSILFLPPSGFGCFVFPKPGRNSGRPGSACLTEFDHQGKALNTIGELECVLTKGADYRIIAWDEGMDFIPMVREIPLVRLTESSSAYLGDLTLGDGDSLALSSGQIDFTVESKERDFMSPIVAAIHKGSVSDRNPSESTINSIRGDLESIYVDLISENVWLESLGHVVLPQDGVTSIKSLVQVDSGALLAASAFQWKWETSVNFSVPEELRNSPEALEFRESFKALNVINAMTKHDGEAGSAVRWASQTSWRHLWDNPEPLGTYLRSYSALVDKAISLGNPAGVFWASYPFSASTWRTTDLALRCDSVLLSPFHPVRLAWLSSVESCLYESSYSAALAGTIEGWNIPLLGPRESVGGRLIALPIDNGQEQLFIGWSMMVTAPVDGPQALKAPEFMGNRRSPGSSSGGLNSSSVTGAMKQFRTMNPHVTTLTVDLAANSPASRSTEIDDAVLSAVEAWALDGIEILPGGIRVLDSLNRKGDAPREELASLIGETSGAPLTWSRYSSQQNQRHKSNIRLLQDAGVAVEVSADGGDNFGVMANVSLRRYEAHNPTLGNGNIGESQPALRRGSGWEPLTEALGLLERSVAVPKIKTQMIGGMIADDDADWTVSGETLVNPSSLAALLSAGARGTQMLWEWRPPFLEHSTTDGAFLERRPYLSVVKIPAPFKKQISEKLASARDRTIGDSEVESLLKTLGSRGVGLSSLVSMGGTHSTGALGFYAALELMSHSNSNEVNRFVLPIDACDEFLRILANDSVNLNSKRRADLLVIELDDDSISLIPIEIKYYGLDVVHPTSILPGDGSSALNEAFEQVSISHKLLRSVEAESKRTDQNWADKALWRNGLAALTEAAMRLHPVAPVNREKLAQRLQRVLDGTLRVEVGGALVLFLQQGAQASGGESFQTVSKTIEYDEENSFNCRVLVANPAVLLDELDAGQGSILNAWESLLDATLEKPSVASRGELDRFSGQGAQERQPQETEVDREIVGIEIDAAKDGSKSLQESLIDKPDKKSKTKSITSTEISGSGVKFPVGSILGGVGHAEAEFWPSNTALNQLNVGVVGDLGTGKTQLLQALILRLRSSAAAVQRNPLSFLVFDYKRDFQGEEFLNSVGGQVLKPASIPLNVFSLKAGYTQQEAFQRAKSFVDVLSKIYGGIGFVQSDALTTSIMALYESGQGKPPTLAMVLEEYRSRVKGADSVTGILNNFVLGGIFSDDPDQLVPFAELINNRVLVVALSELGSDQQTKNALVVLFLNAYYEYMLEQTKWPYVGEDPQLRHLNSFLVVDEATNIMQYEFPVLMQLLLQGREFGVGVILSSQYLSHFKSGNENYGQPLRTWFIHKVPHVTVQQLVQLGLPDATAKDAQYIQELGIHQAYYSSLGVSGRFIIGTPFYKLNQIGFLGAE